MTLSLCHSDDIPEGGARGFELPQGNIFVVKRKTGLFVYLNSCPHLGLPLEWEKDAFLDAEGLYIKCTNHGAFFIPETGECIQGPCLGDSLWPVDYFLEDGLILIDEKGLPESHGRD